MHIIKSYLLISFLSFAVLYSGLKVSFAENQAQIISKAISQNSSKYLIALIRAGYDINQPNGLGITPLIEATNLKNIEIIKILLYADADPNITDRSNTTALHIASRKNYLDIAKLLLDNKANPNLQDFNNTTPLMRAVELNHIEMVRLLLSYKADANLKNSRNLSSYDFAVYNNNPKTLNLLIKDFDYRSLNQLQKLFKLAQTHSRNDVVYILKNKIAQILEDSKIYAKKFSLTANQVSKHLKLETYPNFPCLDSPHIAANTCLHYSQYKILDAIASAKFRDRDRVMSSHPLRKPVARLAPHAAMIIPSPKPNISAINFIHPEAKPAILSVGSPRALLKPATDPSASIKPLPKPANNLKFILPVPKDLSAGSPVKITIPALIKNNKPIYKVPKVKKLLASNSLTAETVKQFANTEPVKGMSWNKRYLKKPVIIFAPTATISEPQTTKLSQQLPIGWKSYNKGNIIDGPGSYYLDNENITIEFPEITTTDEAWIKIKELTDNNPENPPIIWQFIPLANKDAKYLIIHFKEFLNQYLGADSGKASKEIPNFSFLNITNKENSPENLIYYHIGYKSAKYREQKTNSYRIIQSSQDQKQYYILIDSFYEYNKARALLLKAIKIGETRIMQKTDGGRMFQVLMGPFSSKKDAINFSTESTFLKEFAPNIKE
jgi:uncharacterized protein